MGGVASSCAFKYRGNTHCKDVTKEMVAMFCCCEEDLSGRVMFKLVIKQRAMNSFVCVCVKAKFRLG